MYFFTLVESTRYRSQSRYRFSSQSTLCERERKKSEEYTRTGYVPEQRTFSLAYEKLPRDAKKSSTIERLIEVDRACGTHGRVRSALQGFRALRATRHYETDDMYATRLYEKSYRPISRRYPPFSSSLRLDCGLTHMGNTCCHSHKLTDNTVTATISHIHRRACAWLHSLRRFNLCLSLREGKSVISSYHYLL